MRKNDIGHDYGNTPPIPGRGAGSAILVPALLAGLLWWGCGDSTSGTPAGSGGSMTTGGSTGGQVGASGGTRTGGITATGGVNATGGGVAPGSGGNPVTSTGGSVGNGGATGGGGGVGLDGSAGGGAPATGGSAGRDAGGMGGTAGSDGRVGTDVGGSGGGGSGGTGGTVGSGGRVGSGGTLGTGGITSQGGVIGSGGGTVGNDAGASTFDPCPATGVCKIMPLGDSITEGTGYAGGYRGFLYSKAVADGKTITFVGSLTNNPPTGITNFPKSHEGHFAWTIQQIDDIVPTPTLNPSPHIVLLHLGTNDVNQGLSGAPARLKALINQIVTTLPNALVVVAKIIPEPSKASGITAYNNEVPGIVQEFASGGKHVLLIDQYTGFPSSELGDGVHPNQAGYTRMANTWYALIKPYLH